MVAAAAAASVIGMSVAAAPQALALGDDKGPTVANGNGQGYSAGRYVVAAAALALFVPLLAGLSSVLREAEGPGGWLSTTALGAGLVGIALKLASGAPDVAIHRAHIADGTLMWSLVASVVLYRMSPNSSASAFTNGVRGRSRRSPSKVTSTSSSKKATSPVTGAVSGSGSS